MRLTWPKLNGLDAGLMDELGHIASKRRSRHLWLASRRPLHGGSKRGDDGMIRRQLARLKRHERFELESELGMTVRHAAHDLLQRDACRLVGLPRHQPIVDRHDAIVRQGALLESRPDD